MPLVALLIGLAAAAIAAPTAQHTDPSNPLHSGNEAPDEAFCSIHYPALATAITQLCDREPFIVGNNWTIASSEEPFSHSHTPHPASIHIEGACASETTGPPEDITDVCLEISWALCRARVLHGRAVALNRGKADCQRWFVAGWDEGNFSGWEWAGLKVFRMEELMPGYQDGYSEHAGHRQEVV